MNLIDYLKILKVLKSTTEKPINVTSMASTPGQRGSYHIPENQINSFYKKIIKYIIQTGDNIPLVEKFGDFIPFIIDIDIKYLDELTERQYTDETINRICDFLKENLSMFLDIEDKSKYEMWVMEKDNVYPCKSGKYKTKDGIHIICPDLVLKKENYRKMVETIKQQGVFTEIFKNTCVIPPSNKEDQLCDGCFSGWQPYGCAKENESYYKLTKVFRVDDELKLQKLTDEEMSDSYSCDLTIAKRLSMLHIKEDNVTYSQDLLALMDNRLKNNGGSNGNAMGNQEDIYGGNLYYVDNNNIINPFKIVEEEKLNLVKGLIKCLSKERASDYSKWLEVGLCLHNINKSLLEDWKNFSKQGSSYEEDVCEHKWKTINGGHSGQRLGIGSLMFWAKNDNQGEFVKQKNNSLENYVDKSVRSGADADYLVGSLINKYYDDEFISVNVKDEWFYFNGNMWERTLEGTILKTKIHTEIYNLYYEYQAVYSKKKEEQIKRMQEEGDDVSEVLDGKSGAGKHLKNIMSIQMKLLQGNYVNGLMKNARDLFYKKDIMEDFDTNNNLLGFDNGVYDLKNNEFREGRPEDYITISCGFSLPVDKKDLPMGLDDLMVKVAQECPNYDRLKADMDLFLEQIIPDDEVRAYTLKIMSTCLSGENREEGFNIWTGSGGNGKSKLVELITLALGDYACNLPVALLTQKRKASGSASPEMARTRGKRFCVMQEPDVNETLNVGEMKEITGNDKIQARGLYKEPFEFTPQFKLFLMCNQLPHVPSDDEGTWRRLRATAFVSKFVKPDKVDIKLNRHPIDTQLKQKLPFWKIPFMMILLENWREYDKNGVTIPKAVLDKTNQYRNSNDIVGQWISDCCEEIENDTSGVEEIAPTELDNLYCDFKEWALKEEFDAPKRNVFKEALKKWQANSRFGLSIGEKKSDSGVNGYEAKPRFNLKVV